MKTTLFLFGETLIDDEAFARYAHRHLAAAGVFVERTVRQERPEHGFLRELERARTLGPVFLLCDRERTDLVARELCDVFDDTVAARDEHVVPASAEILRPGYYRIANVHVLTVFPGYDLPALDLPDDSSSETLLHFFGDDLQNVRETIVSASATFRVRCRWSEPVKGWGRCRVFGGRFGDTRGMARFLCETFALSVEADDIGAWLIETLQRRGKTLTFAESCTGGRLSAFLTAESGASAVFEGSLVTYSNRLKSEWIAVDEQTLETHGAVSKETVLEMSAGALEVAGASYAVAVSGIAGPTGGVPGKPVGTVFVAVRSENAVNVERLQLHGDRNYIQEQTVLHALRMLLRLDPETFFAV